MESKIISPCISICRTDPVTGYCYGCARTNDEKRLWKDENTKDQWKNSCYATDTCSLNYEKITVFMIIGTGHVSYVQRIVPVLPHGYSQYV